MCCVILKTSRALTIDAASNDVASAEPMASTALDLSVDPEPLLPNLRLVILEEAHGRPTVGFEGRRFPADRFLDSCST